VTATLANGVATVFCNCCDRGEGLAGIIEMLRGSLERHGWANDGERDMCPECISTGDLLGQLSPPEDDRIVYAVGCSWWDSISKAASKPSGLPCCPGCGSVLMETPSEAQWWADVENHERNGHPGYRKMIEWMRGRCFPDFTVAEAAYREAQEAGT
jgi:hypothetical protein